MKLAGDGPFVLSLEAQLSTLVLQGILLLVGILTSIPLLALVGRGATETTGAISE